MEHLASFKEDFFTLLEAGFIAVNQSDQAAATSLFEAASLLDPKNSLSQVGLGYLYLHILEIKKACSYFEAVLKVEPDNQMAKSFFGLCMAMSTDMVTEGEKILEEAAKSPDHLVSNLSKDALHFVEQFVKKEPTPLELMQETRKQNTEDDE